MNRGVLILSSLYIYCASCGVASAIDGVDNPALTSRSKPGETWTSDKLLKAVPLPLPRAKELPQPPPSPPNEKDKDAPQERSSTNAPEGYDGKLPSLALPPSRGRGLIRKKDLEQLEGRDGRSMSPLSTRNRGTSEAPFTSSQVVPVDARHAYPFRTVGKLFFKKQDGSSFICSASVINRRLILTAGHCVHDGSGGTSGYYDDLLFVPAYYKGNAPYGRWAYSWVITTNSWASSNGVVPNKSDFAIIEVVDQVKDRGKVAIGDWVGWLGTHTHSLWPNHTKKIGYPAGFDNGEVMHQVDSQSAVKDTDYAVEAGSDMTGGSSGGPWIENFGIEAEGQSGGLSPLPNRVVGVTSYGPHDRSIKLQGSSIPDEEWTALLQAACKHRAGNCDPSP